MRRKVRHRLAAADGKATKIIIPSAIQSLAALAASAKEVFDSDAANKE